MTSPGTVARLWERWVLPGVTDLCTRSANRFRARLLPRARGRVLEIGIGSGPSLRYYGGAVGAIVGLEPSADMRTRLLRRAAALGRCGVTAVAGSAEALPFADASFDTVTVQLVLCSVGNPAAALAEARRVLRPDGELLFLEHVRHSDAAVARWQDRLTPYWSRCGGGCRLNQDTLALLGAAGFRLAALDEVEDRAWPRFLSHVVWGAAVADR